MADGITIAGTTIDLQEGGEGEPISIGEQSRAFAGNLRSSVRGEKRTFSGVSAPTLEATWDTLRAAVAQGAQIAVSGPTLSGDSITASVKMSAKAIPGLPGFMYITVSGEEV